MSTTYQAQLDFALARLRWCLDKPLTCGGRDWGLHMARALEQLGEAFDRRVDYLESPNGPLARIADPQMLPLTAEARRIAKLRERHQALRRQTRIVSNQFCDAMLLFTPPTDMIESPDALADARAFRLFGVLRSCVEDLLKALEVNCAEQCSILQRDERTSAVAW